MSIFQSSRAGHDHVHEHEHLHEHVNARYASTTGAHAFRAHHTITYVNVLVIVLVDVHVVGL
ncbi:MAG: hypothetical protein ACR2L2_03695 [Acidobacteriota bacterium]